MWFLQQILLWNLIWKWKKLRYYFRSFQTTFTEKLNTHWKKFNNTNWIHKLKKKNLDKWIFYSIFPLCIKILKWFATHSKFKKPDLSVQHSVYGITGRTNVLTVVLRDDNKVLGFREIKILTKLMFSGITLNK